MSFVFLNRYLDLSEAMEDPDAGPIENADFVQTDIPYDFHLPDKHYLPESKREQVSCCVSTPGAPDACLCLRPYHTDFVNMLIWHESQEAPHAGHL